MRNLFNSGQVKVASLLAAVAALGVIGTGGFKVKP
jgi:hypothetical protein